MNNIRNSVRLIGRLGQDPEVKVTANGKSFVRNSVAVTDSYKDQEGKKVENTTWINFIIWGKLGDVMAKWCKKGNQIALEGKLSINTYSDKDGNKRSSAEVIVSEFMMLNSKEAQKANPIDQSQPAEEFEPAGSDDDLPF